ncbi:uncharacterized protein LOC142234937 [Haematobia irritans]|uniref:uncharacterized protein LOC142234937 n=1 Tax=Haematobia irritans TaxID=7368 RepID=UPI003F4FA358
MQNAQNQISIDESSCASGGIGSIRTKTLQRDHLVKRIMGLQTEKAKLMQMSSHQLDVKLSLWERQYDFFEKIQGELESLDERLSTQGFNLSDTVMSSTRVVQQPSLVAHRPHLPTLQLTKFSGDYKEWMGFYNMFCELVHENPELSNIAKFQYLKSCLTDTAARLIQSLEVTADNYESALDMLKQRFDNKRLIFQAHLLNMFQLQSIQKPTVASIRLFIDNINSSLRALRSFASPDQIADGVLLHLIVSKLDKESQSKWEDDIYFSCDLNKSSTSFQLPNWDNLSNFLERRCKTLEIVEITHSNAVREQQKQVQSHSHQQVPRRIASSFITSSEHSKCILCGIGPSHNPFHCTKLCPSQNRCQHCNGLHHTLLHKETLSEVGAATQENVDDANATTNESIALQTSKENAAVILATAIVEICAANGISTMARALLDSCSQSNFITERMANQLKVMRKRVNTKISGIGGTDVFCANHTCTITAKSLTTAFSPTFEAVIIPTISSCHPNQFVDVTSWKIPANIPLADKYFNIPSSIDILLGVDLFWEVLMVGRIKIENQPNFMKTKLGWIVTGSIEGSLQHQRSVSTHVTEANITPQSQGKSTELKYNPSLSSSSEPLLDKLLELFWNLENHEPSRKSILSLEELECEKFFHETTRRCPQTNKFIVRLPFKSTSPVLGQSRQRAQRRLFHLESRLDRDNEIKNEYHRFMKEYMELNHMCVSKQNDVLYHIPHHCVVKPDSSTTRLRVVFDASCATTNGKSLNDLLLVGPTLQDNIFTILTRFRYHKFVLVADIAKMYRQVLVDESDQKWQSILWREHTSKQVETYNLKTVTYGTSCAPYLAVKCLQQTGKEGLERYPLGAKAVLRDFYVDNLMTGADTVEELKIIMKEVIEVLKCGGFPLRKFASNKESVLSDIHPSEREEIVEVEYMHYIKTLGLKWSPTDDVFSFSYSNSECSNTTKRSILAQMASFFDPIGFVNPIISRCKILMQELWRLKIHWDESVPHDIFSEWSHIRKELALVSRLLIPRYVTFNENTCVHVFVDASKRAYGACIYAVTTTNTIESKLLCAKSKVAPIKDTSLPRLELCAALLGSELLHSIKPSFPNAPHKIFCWSDSTITLAWISNEPSRWQSLISNRVEKIQRLTHDCIWQHVPSNLNPADLLSRGTNVNNENKEFWFQGPEFLKHQQTNWPKQHHMSTELDTVQDVTSLMSSAVEDIISSHKYVNRYEKLLRIFAYVNRFLNSTKNKQSTDGAINVNEMNSSLSLICRIIQMVSFSHEINLLCNKRPLHSHSKLIQLSPFLYNGLLLVGGRLKNSSLPFNAKHPILLPGHHPFVRTIINYFHVRNLHAGAQSLHNILRDQFWIINGRNVIRQVIHQCVLCFRCRPTTEYQVMGSLPSDRVERSFPFLICGVDYCGPFSLTSRLRGRPLSKVYLAVFICFSVKAVHLELVPELTTQSFISALKRFIARRGHCSTIYSDNATNFIGANRELREMLKSFMSDDHYKMVNEACGEAGITWRFIPPRSPHFGGLWESAVKQAKHYIRRTIGNHILSHDEMHTVCCQSEAIINSRPLTPLSSDPNDLRPLTPAHFLIGRPLTTLAEPSVVQVNPASLKRYQMVQWIQQQFWDRWRNEYLKTLQQKTKWSTTMINLQVNDLVLLKEENVPPLKWPLARVISCSPGDDGYVRVVTVKTADGTFKRSITKLCKLPISIFHCPTGLLNENTQHKQSIKTTQVICNLFSVSCDMHQKPMHKKRSLCTTIYVQSVGRTKGTRETEKTLSHTLPTAQLRSTSVNIVRIKINTK